MRKICVVTGTRAEYGVSRNLLQRIKEDEELELQLIVTGTHVNESYGRTIDEIYKDGFKVAKVIDIIDSNKKNMGSESGRLVLELNDFFEKSKPDIMILTGDRYEALAAAMVATLNNIPIAHISGGEITEGAIDEQIRHAITKLAHIHFPGALEYAQNIINMGEERWRVFNVGDPGIENIKRVHLLSEEQLAQVLDVVVDKQTLLVTYHPVTLEIEQLEEQMKNLLEALTELDRKMIITYPNSDKGSDYIIQQLENYSKNHRKVKLVKSLGIQKYLSVMKLCGAVIGNSSSALVEAPYLKVPVVNIGDRQKGRLMANNIISCDNKAISIVKAIEKALSPEFKEYVTTNTKSLYGEGETSKEIVKVLKEINIDEKLMKKRLVWSE